MPTKNGDSVAPLLQRGPITQRDEVRPATRSRQGCGLHRYIAN